MGKRDITRNRDEHESGCAMCRHSNKFHRDGRIHGDGGGSGACGVSMTLAMHIQKQSNSSPVTSGDSRAAPPGRAVRTAATSNEEGTKHGATWVTPNDCTGQKMASESAAEAEPKPMSKAMARAGFGGAQRDSRSIGQSPRSEAGV